MRKKQFAISIIALLTLSSCNFSLGEKFLSFFKGTNNAQSENNNENIGNQIIEPTSEISARDFETTDYKDGIKLIKYIGAYRPLINIPSSLNGKKVVSIGTGCFKRSKTQKRSNNESNDDCTAYAVPDEIEEIEEETFESDSTFFVESEDVQEGWKDESLNGSAENENGNIYFNTNPEDILLDTDYTVYTYLPIEDAYCLARCLTHQTEISIPSYVNEKPITHIGYQSFYSNSYIEKVYFPDTIGYLQGYAFQECSNLKSIIFNSPNLSIVKRGAFSNCQSLDVVQMPENMAELSSKVFQNCGTLSEVYLPANLYKVLDDAFESTEVLKIIFAGSRERWDELTERCPNLKSIPVVCLLDGEVIELNDLNKFKDVPSGAYVRIKGILTGYSRQQVSGSRADYAFVTDIDTRYTVICFDQGLLYDLTYVGREVVSIGIKSIYFGLHEIADATLSLTENENIYSVEPMNIDFSNDNIDLSAYINYFTHFEGVLTQVGQSTYIEGIDFYFYYFRNPYREIYFSVGDLISLNFVIIPFNQVIEGIPDMDSVVIISSTGE